MRIKDLDTLIKENECFIRENDTLELNQNYLTDSSDTECSWYPASGKLVVINNSGKEQETVICTPSGRRTVQTEPFGMTVLE